MAPKKRKKEISKDFIGNEKNKTDVKSKDAKVTHQNEKDKNIKETDLNISGTKNKDKDNDKKNKEEKKKGKSLKAIEKEGSDMPKSGIKDKKKENLKKNRRGGHKSQMGKEKKHIEYGKFLMKRGDKYTGYYYRNSLGEVFRHGSFVFYPFIYRPVIKASNL